MGRLVILLSEKGSTGKSNIACCLAKSLLTIGKKTLLIDGGAYRELSYLLKLGEDTVLDFGDFVSGECDINQCVKDVDGLHFIPSGGIIAPDENMAKAMSVAMEDYDFVIYDMPSSNGYIKLLDSFPDFTALLPLIPDKSGIAAASIDSAVISSLDNADGYMIINRFCDKRFRSLDGTLDSVIDTVCLPLAGIIPELKADTNPPFLSKRFMEATNRIVARLNGQHPCLPSLKTI